MIEIKFKGGKNLSRVDWQSRPYLAEVLPWAGRRIRDRVLQRGTTADGRALPHYSKKYAKQLANEGRDASKVDMSRTGQLWASLVGKVNSKGQGVVGFSGQHRDTLGRKQYAKRKLKSGGVSSRNLSNQMLASILAFRQPGRKLPDRPLGYVPPYSFMGLDVEGCQDATRKYSKYWLSKVQAAPKAL